MSNSKRQSLIMIGFGLIVLSAVFVYFSLSQPKVYIGETSSESASYQTDESYQKSASGSENAFESTAYTENVTSDKNINVTYPLNLNTCTLEELITIEGIGNSRASAILEYRDYLGGYTSVEQIKNIKGIGESLYEKVSPYLTV